MFVTALLQQAPGGSLQLGAGRGQRPDGGVINGFPVTQGFDYRTNAGRDRRLHVGAVVARLLLDVRCSWTRFGE